LVKKRFVSQGNLEVLENARRRDGTAGLLVGYVGNTTSDQGAS